MTFTCPRCSATSHHPCDVAEGYCGRCHDWTGGTDMATEYLSITEVARRLGYTHPSALPKDLPEPDARVGRSRGWRVETIEAWLPTWQASRPGRGRRTDLERGKA